jgi:hypothetical protein
VCQAHAGGGLAAVARQSGDPRNTHARYRRGRAY